MKKNHANWNAKHLHDIRTTFSSIQLDKLYNLDVSLLKLNLNLRNMLEPEHYEKLK